MSGDASGPSSAEARRVVVDAMNVIGTTPDGWWRDRDGAALRLLDRLARFAAREDVAVTVVLDGRPLPDAPEGDREGVEVLYARRPGRDAADDRIAEYVATLPDPERTVVVTSDRGLVARVRDAGASTMGARAFLAWLADPPGGPPDSPSR